MHISKLVSVVMLLVALSILSYYVIPEISERTEPVTNVTLSIDKIGIQTNINNESIDKGVYQYPGTKMLFGHRTTHGSIFFNLDKLVVGDIIVFKQDSYRVINVSIVTSNTNLKDNGNLFLVTCTPIGSTSHRIVVEAAHV